MYHGGDLLSACVGRLYRISVVLVRIAHQPQVNQWEPSSECTSYDYVVEDTERHHRGSLHKRVRKPRIVDGAQCCPQAQPQYRPEHALVPRFELVTQVCHPGQELGG